MTAYKKVARQAPLSLRLPAELIARIEAFRAEQAVTPTFARTVCYLLNSALNLQDMLKAQAEEDAA